MIIASSAIGEVAAAFLLRPRVCGHIRHLEALPSDAAQHSANVIGPAARELLQCQRTRERARVASELTH
jgi:hypothetical protein